MIEQQLADNCGFVDNFARGTAHMFKLAVHDLDELYPLKHTSIYMELAEHIQCVQ